MKAVVFAGAGGTEVVKVQERPDPVAGKGEVVVESVYAGVNPADLAQMAGKYPVPLGSPKDIPGLEVSGRVVELGADVSRWKLGDRVFGVVGGGGLATRVVVHERHVAPVPEVLDDLQAAAIPEAYVTAHDAIVTQAGLRMGERLLVNGASGGVGLAAVQIGVATGATVFAYARSAEAREKLAALGATPVESPEEASDIQVVLELVGAPNMEANFKAIAVLGRIIVVGNGAGLEFPMNLRILMGKRGTADGDTASGSTDRTEGRGGARVRAPGGATDRRRALHRDHRLGVPARRGLERPTTAWPRAESTAKSSSSSAAWGACAPVNKWCLAPFIHGAVSMLICDS